MHSCRYDCEALLTYVSSLSSSWFYSSRASSYSPPGSFKRGLVGTLLTDISIGCTFMTLVLTESVNVVLLNQVVEIREIRIGLVIFMWS